MSAEQDRADGRAGWTLDTLRQFVQAGLDSICASQETQARALREMLQIQITDLKDMLNERYGTQTKALDAAFSAASQAVAAALNSAREASAKAEANAERRFDLFRVESGLQIKTVSDKLDDEVTRIFERMGDLTSRLDLIQGQQSGAVDSRNTTRLDNGQMIAVIGVLLAVAGAIFAFTR